MKKDIKNTTILAYCAILTLLGICYCEVSRKVLGFYVGSEVTCWWGHYFIGFLLLCAMSFFGHHLINWLARYAGWLNIVISGVFILVIFQTEPYYNIAFLTVPLGIIAIPCICYSFHDSDTSNLLIAASLLFCNSLIILFCSLSFSCHIFSIVSAITLLCYCQHKRWLGPSNFLVIGATIVFGTALLVYCYDGGRSIEEVIDIIRSPHSYLFSSEFLTQLFHELLGKSAFFGQGDTILNVTSNSTFPYYEACFLAYLSSVFGLWLIVYMAVLFFGFFYICITATIKLKSLPKFIAITIVVYLMAQTLCFFAFNLGFPLFYDTSLPFFSCNYYLWSNMALTGLMLAAFRMEDYDDDMDNHYGWECSWIPPKIEALILYSFGSDDDEEYSEPEYEVLEEKEARK